MTSGGIGTPYKVEEYTRSPGRCYTNISTSDGCLAVHDPQPLVTLSSPTMCTGKAIKLDTLG